MKKQTIVVLVTGFLFASLASAGDAYVGQNKIDVTNPLGITCSSASGHMTKTDYSEESKPASGRRRASESQQAE